jgi:transcriptional adapter 2-alpha
MAPSGTAERGDATSAMSADDTDVVSGSGAAPTATDLPEPSGKVQEAPPSKPPTSGRLRDTIKHEATGYLKFRDEFDPEYDAEAELPIADLEFNADDAPHVRKAKLHMLELYAERLVERERRREVIKAKGCVCRFWFAVL